MSYSRSLMPTVNSYSEFCDEAIIFFTQFQGITVSADTGTGDSRVVLFALPGTNALLEISFVSTSYCQIRFKRASGTYLNWLVRAYYSAPNQLNLEVGKNGTTWFIYLWTIVSSTIYSAVLWSTERGNGDKVTMYSEMTALASDTTTNVVYSFASVTDNQAVQKWCSDGSQILIPVFPYEEMSTTFLDAKPAANLYSFRNKDNVSRWVPFTIGAHTFVTLGSTNNNTVFLIRV